MLEETFPKEKCLKQIYLQKERRLCESFAKEMLNPWALQKCLVSYGWSNLMKWIGGLVFFANSTLTLSNTHYNFFLSSSYFLVFQ